MRATSGVSLAVAALLLGGSTPASAIPLDALEGTTHSIAGLTIQFTDVRQTGGIDLADVDLSFVVDALGVGFDITPLVAGALDAANKQLEILKLEFTVTSAAGIDRVVGHLDAQTKGILSAVIAWERIEESGFVMPLFVTWLGSNTHDVEDLRDPLHTLTIKKHLVIGAGWHGSASVSSLSQRFRVVPEPATALMLLFGLSGIAYFGRSRN
jgi:hypothetical protein